MNAELKLTFSFTLNMTFTRVIHIKYDFYANTPCFLLFETWPYCTFFSFRARANKIQVKTNETRRNNGQVNDVFGAFVNLEKT